MPFRIFTIALDESLRLFDVTEVNQFCMNKRIISSQWEFFLHQGTPCWTIFLEYQVIDVSPGDSKGRQAQLSTTDQRLYQELRAWRKEISEQKGLPAYVVANNQMLLDLVEKKPKTLEGIEGINGMGKKKVKEYGNALLALLKAFEETS